MSPRTKKRDDSPTTDGTEINWVYKFGRLNMRPRGDDFKFRLNVIGATAADVVSHIGGWLFDRSMMGWDITVLIAEPGQDFRALQILGVTPLPLDTVLQSGMRLPICDGISVAADLYFGDSQVKRHVLRRLHRRESEFTLWGADLPAESNENTSGAMSFDVIAYQLTRAAGSFKAHAVAAGFGVWPAPAVAPTEAICDGRFRDRFRQSPLRAVDRPDSGICTSAARSDQGQAPQDMESTDGDPSQRWMVSPNPQLIEDPRVGTGLL